TRRRPPRISPAFRPKSPPITGLKYRRRSRRQPPGRQAHKGLRPAVAAGTTREFLRRPMNLKPIVLCLLAAGLGIGLARAAANGSLAEPIRIVRAVGPEGQGNAAASPAWKQLAAADATALPALLAAMDGANELALNWLRSAVDTIAARELRAGRALPITALTKFLRDGQHHPRARRLAYELIQRGDASVAQALLPGMLDDPSTEL